MSRCFFAAFILTHCLLSGCNRTPSTTSGNVAVVDLDKVAAQLGLSEQWSAELSASQSNANAKLAGYQQQLNDQLQQKQAEVVTANRADTLVPAEQKTQLVAYQQQLNGKLRQAQAEAKKHLNQQRSRIIQNFRRQAKQASAAVAGQQGYDVVLTKNDSVVLTFTAAADITQDVTMRLQQELQRSEQTTSKARPTAQQ